MTHRARFPLIVLETHRLILRPMSETDASLIVQWRNSQRIASISKLSSQAGLTVEQHLAWFSRTRTERVDYVIVQKEGLQLIGSLSWSWHEHYGSQLCAEMGKYIGEASALGKGYATEATILWLQYAFQDIGIDVVFAITRFDNLPNIKLNMKLGFEVQPWPSQLKRVSDDWVFMNLTKDQWCSLQKTYPLK